MKHFKDKSMLVFFIMLLASTFWAVVPACNESTEISPNLPPIETGIGVPSFTITRDFVFVDDTATVSMDINTLIDTLLAGAKIETEFAILSLQKDGPGKVPIPVRLIIPLRKQ